MTEYEKKLLLSREEYSCLAELFRKNDPLQEVSVVRQTNYYFDTDDLLMNRRGITCRIRLKNGILSAIMKQHFPVNGYSTETEAEISGGLLHNAFTGMGLKLQGELLTERYRIFTSEGLDAVLDKNSYLGYTDYELEIEYVPAQEKNASAFLQRVCGLLSRQTNASEEVLSKSGRFFERKALLAKEKAGGSQ